MNAPLPVSAIPAKYWLRADNGAVFRALQGMARSGDVTEETLGQIKNSRNIHREKELRYYLASLYLLIDQAETANELLRDVKPGIEMKRYFAVLNHCRKQALPIPSLSKKQQQAMDNIDERLRHQRGLCHRIEQAGGFSVVGNAPASRSLSMRDDLCTFYFNEYTKNPAIDGIASIHVVTPSWRKFSVIESDALVLTGNNIFHRRSRVWERFNRVGCISAIFMAPGNLWSSLYSSLGTSPTAGLLVLEWVNALLDSEDLADRQLAGHVAGFSLHKPGINHNYNREKISSRHNWDLEPQLAERAIASLRSKSMWVAS